MQEGRESCCLSRDRPTQDLHGAAPQRSSRNRAAVSHSGGGVAASAWKARSIRLTQGAAADLAVRDNRWSMTPLNITPL
jgi:hypothetical protein